MRRDNPGDLSGSARGRKRYLPSAQVVQELATVEELNKLAEELRQCLSDSAPESLP
jgi:hypothetical protein